MSNPESNPRAAALFGLLAFVFAVATLMLAFYLVPRESRGLAFGLSVANLIIGELLIGAELARSALAPRSSRVFVASLGGVLGPFGYLGGAAILAILAVFSAPLKLLVVLHVLLLLVAVAGIAMFSVVGEAAERASGGKAPANAFLDDLKRSVRQVTDRAASLPIVAKQARDTLHALGEDVRFTYSGSDEGSVSDDAELRRELEAIDASLNLLLSNPSDPAASEAIVRAGARFRTALQRRNDGIKQRR
jgi:hypothetical protein